MNIRALKTLLVVVILLFGAATLYISITIFERESALEKISRYNIAWLMSQATTEYARLEQRVSAFAVAGSNVDKDEVELRLDIVFNRLKLLQGGNVEELFVEYPDQRRTIEQLTSVLLNVQPLIESLEIPGNAQKALDLLTPIDVKLAALAAAANAFSGQKVSADQRELLRLHWMFSMLAAGLIFCGLVLAILLIWHNRLLSRAKRDLYALTVDLKETAEKLAHSNREVQEKNATLKEQNETLLLQDVVLRTQNERFDAALNNMSQSLCMFDSKQSLIVCNRQFKELFGLPEELVAPGTPFDAILEALTRSTTSDGFQKLFGDHQRLVKRRQIATLFEDIGNDQVIAIAHQPMADGGWLATYEDVSERRRAEARIAHMAHHDGLTDLPNRARFEEAMNAAFTRHHQSGQTFCVLYLDLDQFKNVNDTLGHPVGDGLLRAVAHRLLTNVGDSDLVARLGGDEFGVLLTTLNQPKAAEEFANKIIKALAQPFTIEGNHITTGASIGIAVAPTDGATPELIMKHVDMALYRAKSGGRQTYRFFEASMNHELQQRRRMETCLRGALANNEFELAFQPLVDMSTTEIVCCEALLRWNSPELGAVSPVEFIPMAEDMGLIASIGEWVLRTACKNAARWPNDVRVAVNLSPIQFKNKGLDQVVASALSHSGLPAGRLELEITESLFLEASDSTRSILNRFRALGVKIALDDFGTGYSSLSYLRSFPFDKIKIDQSFIRDIGSGNDSLAIIKSVIGLGNSLGMKITAEGIETVQQADTLREAGCTEAQGYYFYRPMSELKLNEQWRRRAAAKVAAA